MINARTEWMDSESIRPYVYVRPSNRIDSPGEYHDLNWFEKEPIYINPLDVGEMTFTNQIYDLENKAFGPTLAMPRWVFYDCAVIPGFIAGYAMRSESLPETLKKVLEVPSDSIWTPLSLFIIIPTMTEREWVAHNLCSVNSLLPKEERFYGLGFVSKAFGLWYANVEICSGVTQWMSPAKKLHAHYGDFEILTAYTPVHSYAETLTYRVKTNVSSWERFFSKESHSGFFDQYDEAGFQLDPTSVSSMKAFQTRLQEGEGPFFLNSQEVAAKDIGEVQKVYKLK